MKFRITEDHMRIRLAVEELETLALGREIDINLQLQKAVKLTLSSGEMNSVEWSENALNVSIEESLFSELSESDNEGFHLKIGEIKVLIQKDYACIGKDETVNVGLFPNPKEGNEAC